MVKRLALYRSAWDQWTARSVNHRILNAVLTVAIFSGGVKIVVLVKELAVAWRFGIGDNLDVYFTGLLVPAMISTIIAGSMYAAFMPTYVQVSENEGPGAAQKLLLSTTAMSIALLAAGAFLLAMFAPYFLPFLATGFTPAKLGDSLHILYLLLPWVVISGVQTLWSATLNSKERFALAATAPIITPIVILAVLWLNTGLEPAGLALATTAGALIETAILFYSLRRRNLWPALRWYGVDRHLRQVGRQLLPIAVGSAIMTSTVLVEQYFAARLPAGSVSTLNYGSRLILFILTFATATLGTALFPYYARLAATEEWRQLRLLLLRYVGLTLVATIPLTIALFFLSDILVALMYQRGAFSAEAAAQVAQVQRIYALQAPFYVAAILCVRLISALRRNTLILIGAVGNLGVSIAVNLLLDQAMGVAGIALASVCVYAFSFTFLFIVSLLILQRKTNQLSISLA